MIVELQRLARYTPIFWSLKIGWYHLHICIFAILQILARYPPIFRALKIGWLNLRICILAKLWYWQEICRREAAKFGANLEHIFNFAGLRIISIYRRWWYKGSPVIKSSQSIWNTISLTHPAKSYMYSITHLNHIWFDTEFQYLHLIWPYYCYTRSFDF